MILEVIISPIVNLLNAKQLQAAPPLTQNVHCASSVSFSKAVSLQHQSADIQE